MGRVIYIKGSLFQAPRRSVLVHACNCQGVWGGGIAAEMARHFPDAYDSYRAFCVKDLPRPGAIKLCFERDYVIGNILTSFDLGGNVDTPNMIIEATERALNRLRIFTNAPMYSNRFNSGLFKVPWERTEAVIKRVWPREWHVYEG